MWLVNTETYRLHSFSDEEIPEYAILSHCWGEEEVSFAIFRDAQMIEDGTGLSREEEEELPMFRKLRVLKQRKLMSMKGWKKVLGLCVQSRSLDLDWAWIDTACIDKSSSAELQEAINAMYRWYQDAQRCFVYMEDVFAASQKGGKLIRDQFKDSKWFTRGWTLQELVAPSFERIVFLNQDWKPIEPGVDLIGEVATRTGISRTTLAERSSKTRRLLLSSRSVAERMSWASQRQVSRGEDAAYCLLGLFGINMPMLYGEGRQNAFERLQLEILKISPDETILAWNGKDAGRRGTALATSPEDFSLSGSYQVKPFHEARRSRGNTIQVTQRGVLMEAILLDGNHDWIAHPHKRPRTSESNLVLPLMCSNLKNKHDTVFIPLKHWTEDLYYRDGPTFSANLKSEGAILKENPQRICIMFNHEERVFR